MRSFLAVSLIILMFGCNEKPSNPDVELVKELILKAYVEGIHNNGNIIDIRAGFHPDFEMLTNREGDLSRFSIAEWIERIEESRKNDTDPKRVRTEVKFLDIDVTGNTASVKFELLREGKTIFTDYMYLYKFGDEWKIVCKVYHRH